MEQTSQVCGCIMDIGEEDEAEDEEEEEEEKKK